MPVWSHCTKICPHFYCCSVLLLSSDVKLSWCVERNFNVWAEAKYLACILLRMATNHFIKPQKVLFSAFIKNALQLKDQSSFNWSKDFFPFFLWSYKCIDFIIRKDGWGPVTNLSMKFLGFYAKVTLKRWKIRIIFFSLELQKLVWHDKWNNCVA